LIYGLIIVDFGDYVFDDYSEYVIHGWVMGICWFVGLDGGRL